MRSFSNCRLLDKVGYCMRQPTEATNIIDEPITIRDTFPFNPDSKTAPETARRWAKQYHFGDDRETFVPDEVISSNAPFAVTIVDLHHRSEGGRAYKVVDPYMRRFDLREDQVLEVMAKCGIEPGGKVPGLFVWGTLGSQMRLALVGGELHKAMVAGADALKAHKAAQVAGTAPTEGTLQVGHVFRFEEQVGIELTCCGEVMPLGGNLSLRGAAGATETRLAYSCSKCFRRVAVVDRWPPPGDTIYLNDVEP